jgi:hypothetical protein
VDVDRDVVAHVRSVAARKRNHSFGASLADKRQCGTRHDATVGEFRDGWYVWGIDFDRADFELEKTVETSDDLSVNNIDDAVSERLADLQALLAEVL